MTAIEEQVREVVVEVLKRLLPRIGATGERGTVIAVFCGATVDYDESVRQIRSLILQGYRVQVVLSHGAEALYGKYLWEQFAGFPHITPLDDTKWLNAVKECRGVVVPMLSLNTLSKLSLLIADNLGNNIILHALFAGKPVVIAKEGVDPNDPGRKIPHFDRCGPVMAAAIEERLRLVSGFGCRIVEVRHLSDTLADALEQKTTRKTSNGKVNGTGRPAAVHAKSNIVTAADVMQASYSGSQLQLTAKTVVTPLARELANKHGVCLLQDRSC
jgi:hypothetical protein